LKAQAILQTRVSIAATYFVLYKIENRLHTMLIFSE